MTLTNKYNLPRPLVSAIENDLYKKVGDISVTELILPPRIRQLQIRHRDEITEDYSDRIWMLLGSSVHAILERADTHNQLVEERLTSTVLGWIVSGQPDLLGDGVLTDWKVTSVYSFLLGEKPEWTAQLNCYKWLYEQNGFQVDKLQIVAILRDWMKSRALKEADYPPCAVMVVDIPIWGPREVKNYIEERVRLHQEAQKIPDDALMLCTPQERWERPTTYAVKKLTNKKARRVFLTIEDARLAATEQEEVIVRPGESVRCKSYCTAMPFCNQFKQAENLRTLSVIGITPNEP